MTNFLYQKKNRTERKKLTLETLVYLSLVASSRFSRFAQSKKDIKIRIFYYSSIELFFFFLCISHKKKFSNADLPQITVHFFEKRPPK